MNKGTIYTFLVFCLSFTVVFGGWFLTKEMLNCKETEILVVKGQVSMDVSETDKTQSDTSIQGEFEGEVLSEETMAEVLTVWEAGGREVLHEPMEGQMSMEQAIKAGRDWINTLAEKNILSADLLECNFESTNAVLCTLDSKASIEKSLISYWTVTFENGDVDIVLKIHATSGQVWRAVISIGEDNMLFGTCTDEEVIAIAFPFLTKVNTEVIKKEGKTFKISERGKVYATLRRDSVVVDKQKPVARLLLSLCTDIE